MLRVRIIAATAASLQQLLRTRVCDGTATILSIFVAQSSRAGHQLTAAYDG
jgi:hypothetical protein